MVGEDLKDRSVYVYLPSGEKKKEWEDLANEAGTSLSKYVVEHVENSMKQDSEEGKTRAELQEELQSREERVNELETELRRKKKLIEALEEEVRKHRSKEFLQEPGPETRKYDEELIQVLKTGGTVENDEILNRLDVDHGETEAVKAINKQLELLESYGLIESTKRGWRWRS